MKIKRLISACLLVISVCLLGFFTGTSSQAQDEEYYVTFSADNYQKKSSNKMTMPQDKDYYILEAIDLDATNKFRVESNSGVIYYNKNGNAMNVSVSTASKYNIYFAKDYIYDDARVENTNLSKTDAHISYEYYLKPSYKAVVGANEYELKFNQFNSSYDQYYIDEIKLNKGDVVLFKDSEGNSVGYSLDAESYTVSETATYSILYTPGKTSDSNLYLYNENGAYGTGADYKYYSYISEASLYYVVFMEDYLNKYTEADKVTIESKTAYKLSYNRDDEASCYKSLDFYVGTEDANLNYTIYRFDEITNDYILINDDNDEDTLVSKIDLSDRGWYQISLSLLGQDKYLTKAIKQERAINDYYLASNLNNYLFDEYGNRDLNSLYKFEEIKEDNEDLYNKDYAQYLLYLTIDEYNAKNKVEFYITNGVDDYKDGSDYVCLNQPGKYEIIFSPEHSYSRLRNYKYSLLKDENPKEEITISNLSDFVNFVNSCNNDSEYSLNKVFNLTKDLDASRITSMHIRSFSGEFNGNYHTISNLTISSDDATEEASLFGLVTKIAIIRNVEFDNLRIEAETSSYVGLVGRLFGNIENLTVNGSISGKSYVGVVAYMGNYKLDKDDSSVDSTKKVGYSRAINVTNNADVLGKSYIGGIAGFNAGKIINSTNYGQINNKQYPTNDNVRCIGGIAGYSIGEVISSNNRGIVGYASVGVFVGGIAGLSNGAFYFTNNYGDVYGRTNVGGIVGYYTTVSSDSNYNDYFGSSDYQEIIDSILNSSKDNDDVVEATNLNKNIILYCYNNARIFGNTSVGGICGLVDIKCTIRACINNANITVESGSYVGGIAGQMKNATITESISYGNIFASGLNSAKYVGGIAGYIDGTISYSMSYTVIKGVSYLGGIAGYATKASNVISNISDCYFVTESTSTYIGNILGYADSLDMSSSNFNDLIKYNYYIDNIYKGINQNNYGADSDFAACLIDSKSLISYNTLSMYLDNRFANDYYIGGTSTSSYPFLKAFEEQVVYDDFDVTLDYNSLAKKQMDALFEIEAKIARESKIYIFMEWNKDSGDVDDHDSFEINSICRVYDGNMPAEPGFKYASLLNGAYYYQGDKARYFVEWDMQDSNIIYAKYEVITTSISSDDKMIIVEGEFAPETKLTVKCMGDNYVLIFTVNGKEVTYDNIVVKIKDTNSKVYVCNENEKEEVSSNVYGDYTSFNLKSSTSQFGLIVRDNSMPGYLWAIIGASAAVLICLGAFFICYGIKRKKQNQLN